MKKLYVGLGISFALIIGGVAYGSLARPTVDMTKLSKVFYNQQGHYEIPTNNKLSYKLISLEENTLKIKVDFESYSGMEDIFSLIQRAAYDESGLNESDKKKVEKFFKDLSEGKEPLKKGGERIYKKDKVFSYKWADKPFNMSLVRIEDKAYKRKDGIQDSYPVYNVLQKNGEISLSGEIVSKPKEGGGSIIIINGIKGKGSLELEYTVTY